MDLFDRYNQVPIIDGYLFSSLFKFKDFLEHSCCIYFETSDFRRVVETSVSPEVVRGLKTVYYGDY